MGWNHIIITKCAFQELLFSHAFWAHVVKALIFVDVSISADPLETCPGHGAQGPTGKAYAVTGKDTKFLCVATNYFAIQHLGALGWKFDTGSRDLVI